MTNPLTTSPHPAMHRYSHLAAIITAAAISVLAGCAAVTYDVAQDAAIKACDQRPTVNDRDDCRKQHQTSYEQYERQRQDVVERGTEKPVATKSNTPLCFKRASSGEVVCPN